MDFLIYAAILVVGVAAGIVIGRLSRPSQSDRTAQFANAGISLEKPATTVAEEDDGEPTAEQLLLEADALYADRQYSDAADKYGEALNAAIEDKGQDDVLVAVISEKQGDADLVVNGENYDEDTIPTEYLLALSIRERRSGPFSPDLQPILRKVIAFYDRVGAHQDAEGLARRLRDIEEAVERARRDAERPTVS